MGKKLLILLLVAVFVLATMIGCGKEAGQEATADTSQATQKVEETAGAKEETGGAKKDDTILVGCLMKTLGSPYFVCLDQAIQDLSKEQGWECISINAAEDVAAELEGMESLVSSGCDLIFYDCIDPTAAVSCIEVAYQEKIPVINIDSGVDEGAHCVTTVYSDNKQNGRAVGLKYADYFNKKEGADAEIISVLLSGVMGNVAGRERSTGLFCGIIEGRTGLSEEESWKLADALYKQIETEGKGFCKEANFTVRGQGWGNWAEADGLVAAEDLITANRDLNTVLGENDQMLFGAITALTNAGITYGDDGDVNIVAAADGAKAAYDLIKEGKYFGTGENSPWLVSQKAFEIGKEILLDGKDPWGYPWVTLTEAVGVTIDNVDERYDYGF